MPTCISRTVSGKMVDGEYVEDVPHLQGTDLYVVIFCYAGEAGFSMLFGFGGSFFEGVYGREPWITLGHLESCITIILTRHSSNSPRVLAVGRTSSPLFLFIVVGSELLVDVVFIDSQAHPISTRRKKAAICLLALQTYYHLSP